jgi:hypothetical protein
MIMDEKNVFYFCDWEFSFKTNYPIEDMHVTENVSHTVLLSVPKTSVNCSPVCLTACKKEHLSW